MQLSAFGVVSDDTGIQRHTFHGWLLMASFTLPLAASALAMAAAVFFRSAMEFQVTDIFFFCTGFRTATGGGASAAAAGGSAVVRVTQPKEAETS